MKPIRITTYTINENGRKTLSNFKEFDNHGNLLEEVDYSPDENALFSRSYEYNALNDITKDELYFEGNLQQSTYTEYDSLNRKDTIRTEYPGGEQIIIEFDYTQDQTIRHTYNSHNEIEEIYVESFNQADHLIKKATYNGKNELIHLIELEYDQEGKCFQEIEEVFENNETLTTNFEYFPNGKTKTITTNNESGTMIHQEKFEYTHDLIRIKTIDGTGRNGEPPGIYSYDYNASGMIIKEQLESLVGKFLYSIHYDYDEYGNISHMFYLKTGFFNPISGVGDRMLKTETIFVNEYLTENSIP